MILCVRTIEDGGDFPGDPVVKPLCSAQGASVQSLVGELRSRMLPGMAKKKKREDRYAREIFIVFP